MPQSSFLGKERPDILDKVNKDIDHTLGLRSDPSFISISNGTRIICPPPPPTRSHLSWFCCCTQARPTFTASLQDATKASLSKKYGKLGPVLASGAGGIVHIIQGRDGCAVYVAKEFRSKRPDESEKEYRSSPQSSALAPPSSTRTSYSH